MGSDQGANDGGTGGLLRGRGQGDTFHLGVGVDGYWADSSVWSGPFPPGAVQDNHVGTHRRD